MRKALAILSIVVLGILLYIYLDQFYIRNILDYETDESILTEEKIMDDILSHEESIVGEVEKLQTNAKSISDFNSTLTKNMYSNTLTNEELMTVVEFQYGYFDEKLKAENSVEDMYSELKEELKQFEEYGIEIIGFDSVSPEQVENVQEIGENEYLSIVKVKYYTNYPDEAGNIYIGYVFRMDENDLWNLYGFRRINQFPIVKN